MAASAGITSDGAAPAAEPSSLREANFGGLRTMWQLPAEPPRGLLFLAHGMCHGAEDFFGEPGFPGLPEEQRIVASALGRSFVAVAASSTDRARKAWRPEVDGPLVARAVREVLRSEGLSAELPCCALGVSNGGAFVLALPLWLRLRAVVCQIMSVPAEGLLEVPGLPPVLFVHMPRDSRTGLGVAAAVQALRQAGKVAEELRCGPQRVSEAFFAERCPGIGAEVSARMAGAMAEAGLLSAEGMLLRDPRQAAWREALRPLAPAEDSLEADRSAISEVLNVAWAMHEITAEGIGEALAFCERAGGLAEGGSR